MCNDLAGLRAVLRHQNRNCSALRVTPGLHYNIPAHKIFARVWVAQEPICFIGSG